MNADGYCEHFIMCVCKLELDTLKSSIYLSAHVIFPTHSNKTNTLFDIKAHSLMITLPCSVRLPVPMTSSICGRGPRGVGCAHALSACLHARRAVFLQEISYELDFVGWRQMRNLLRGIYDSR